MATGLRLRSSLLDIKQRLTEGREKLHERHAKGSPGIQVSAALTDLLDTTILELFDQALVDLGPELADRLRPNVVLVPHGGYGRRDVAPYSDVDLMLLHAPQVARDVAPLAERLLRDVFDVGLTLGFSVRTPRQSYQLARREPQIWTSLTESRYLAGSATLFSHFARRFQRQARRNLRALIDAIEKSRLEERRQYGETVYLLEPNIKRSRGGLRDLHLLRWIGFARYGVTDPDSMQLHGALSPADYRVVRHATEFLLRLRNEMHFFAGKPNDVLDRAEQLRVAEVFGVAGSEAQLPVERFMQEYFRHTMALNTIVSRFVTAAKPGNRWMTILGPLFSHQVEGDFRVEMNRIVALPRGLAKVTTDLGQVLRLADLANLYDKTIAPATSEAIRTALPNMPDEVSPQVAERFLSLLSQPTRLGELLRDLHEMRALEKIVPAFAHARGLLQFNEYHKYTVDEHCLRAVERVTELQSHPGILGQVYRNIKQKRVLHLALLLHDLGKGLPGDHSDVGREIAAQTAERLRMSKRESEALQFLVHKHLRMSHLAFRRDTSDERLAINFAVEVGSPELLQMLCVLTVADLSAVGPGVWNSWKAEVLTDLYVRTMQHLAGDVPVVDTKERLDRRRLKIRAQLTREERSWFEEQIDKLPAPFLMTGTPDQIANDLRQLRGLQPGEVVATGRYSADRGAVEYTVGTHESIGPGVFHRLTGALSSHGQEILSAEITTLDGGLVLDRFYVRDPDYTGAPPEDRLEETAASLRKALMTTEGGTPAFRRVWKSGGRLRMSGPHVLPTQVKIDNSTSERFTIIDVFAADCTGLLYTITRTLYEMGLSVSLAKIATYLDQVVDVFYVSDRDTDKKIADEERLLSIRDRLLGEISSLEARESG